jgi:hypothetical protein
VALAAVRAPALPPLAHASQASACSPSRGSRFCVARRRHVYAALDYGHSGAGHGHPDRLNVMLVRDEDRWLDDVGLARTWIRRSTGIAARSRITRRS